MRTIQLICAILFGHYSFAQLEVSISTTSTTICRSESLNLRSSIVSGTPSTYQWSSTVATFNTSSTANTSAVFSDSGYVYLLASDGTNSFKDSLYINVNSLPEIDLKPIGDICCDFGDLALNYYLNTPSGTPSSGAWSCAQYPNLVKNNVFYTDTACELIQNPSANIQTYVQYTYSDPSTLCVNTDSVFIQVNKLPSLILNDKDYCQDYPQGIRLDDEVVISPANTSLGTPSWKCIDSNWTGNHFYADMLENRGSSFAPDYWLNIDTSNYTMQNPGKDTISLEFSYVDYNGCKSSEEIDVRVWRVPEVRFSKNRELCFDEGEVDLDSLTGVNISSGRWSCFDSTGYESCFGFSPINGSLINTMNTIDDSQAHSWILRYFHDATGCPAQNLIPITIYPRPAIHIDQFSQSQFCETHADIPLQATPVGGMWSSSDPTALDGNVYSPASASVQDMNSQIYYDYTSPLTGCSNKDSIQVRVDAQPIIDPIADTAFCAEIGKKEIKLKYNLTGQNCSVFGWIAPSIFGSNSRASLSQYSDDQDEELTLQLQNMVSDTFRIVTYAFPKTGSACSDVDDYFDVLVHPTPEGTIAISKAGGCPPLNADFTIAYTNQIDTSFTTLNWDLLNGNTSAKSNPSAVFTKSGEKNISVSVESKYGCQSVLDGTLDVYPRPVAEFVPNPNNNAPISNPRFVFNNISHVGLFGGSAIVSSSWKFDEGGSSTNDTSSATSPAYFYPASVASYQVLLKVETNHGCVDSFSYPVHVGKPGSVSVEEVTEHGIVVYPNPSTGRFRLDGLLNREVKIVNILGEEVPFRREADEILIHKEGLYILSVIEQDGRQINSKRIIIE